MGKYISLFEEYNNSTINRMTTETSGSWANVRDVIQQHKPFTIVCFNDDESYSRFIDTIQTDYIKQEFFHDHIGDDLPHLKLPSIFVPKSKINIFGTKDPYKEYDIFCIITQQKEHVMGQFKDELVDMGNELVSSLSEDDVNGEDYFKIGSMFYKFINFLG